MMPVRVRLAMSLYFAIACLLMVMVLSAIGIFRFFKERKLARSA